MLMDLIIVVEACLFLVASYGIFIRGFTCNLGRAISVVTELWSLVHGIRLAHNVSVLLITGEKNKIIRSFRSVLRKIILFENILWDDTQNSHFFPNVYISSDVGCEKFLPT